MTKSPLNCRRHRQQQQQLIQEHESTIQKGTKICQPTHPAQNPCLGNIA